MRVWETPGLREIKMNAEIGAYAPDGESTDPSAGPGPEPTRVFPHVIAGGAASAPKRAEPPDHDPAA